MAVDADARRHRICCSGGVEGDRFRQEAESALSAVGAAVGPEPHRRRRRATRQSRATPQAMKYSQKPRFCEMEPRTGLDPVTPALRMRCATNCAKAARAAWGLLRGRALIRGARG